MVSRMLLAGCFVVLVIGVEVLAIDGAGARM
jgi:hypothetical protein